MDDDPFGFDEFITGGRGLSNNPYVINDENYDFELDELAGFGPAASVPIDAVPGGEASFNQGDYADAAAGRDEGGDALPPGPHPPGGAITEEEAITAIQTDGFVDTVQNPGAAEEMIANFNRTSETLEIKPVRNRGRGLFAKKPIPKNTRIGHYPGPRIRSDVAEKLPASYDKQMSHVEEGVLMGDLQDPNNFSPVTFCNDPGYQDRGLGEYWEPRFNANVINEWDHDLDQMFFTTKKPIKPGEELLFFYGYDYWLSTPDADYFPTEQHRKEAETEVVKLRRDEARKQQQRERAAERKRARYGK